MKSTLCQYVMRWAWILLMLSFGQPTVAQLVGQPLPAWQEGELDIHHISTGWGNATFGILPDGTTFLIDAGAVNPVDWRTNAPRQIATKPSTSRRPGEWIARYIMRCFSTDTQPSIDYAILTHFHDDHIGSPVRAPRQQAGDYALTGITDVAELVPIRRILDRGWPSYDYPQSLANDSVVLNYRRFLDVQQKGRQPLRVARFQAGRSDQIVLLKRPASYPTVEVRNIAVNGQVWTGTGQQTRALFPELTSLPVAQYPTENMCSIALRIQYGAFRYFSGGDITGVVRFGSPAWHDVETPIAAATGPVDVLLMDHHGHEDSQNGNLLTSLRPRTLIVPVWHESHAARSMMERVYDSTTYLGQRDVFATSLLEPTRAALGGLAGLLKSMSGHVLVRVSPVGKTYRVIIIDDSDESMRIKAIHGPYKAQ